LDKTSVKNAIGSANVGMQNATLTESQPQFKQVKLELNKLYAYTEDPNELETDSIVSMGSLLTQMFGEALAFEEDYSFINGDGVGKPEGIINAAATVAASRGTASTIFFDEIDSILSSRTSSGEHEASRRMKTELLIQLDGLIKSSNERVFLLAASNLPWELDMALLRRLEKRILVHLPSIEAREDMIKKLIPLK
jgi:HK97 family phage major capsid protein